MPEIIFNEELWNTGFIHNCCAKGNALYSEARAFYISHSIDSLANGTVWGRFCLFRNKNQDVRYKLSYFARDYKTIFTGGELIDIDKFILNNSYSLDEKLALLDEFWLESVQDPLEMPLFNANGRFLWFMLELDTLSDSVIMSIDKLKIEFGRESWTEYLPDIYRLGENSFLNRFLSMFQSVYSDLDAEIFGISRLFDIDCADSERLSWLSAWVAVDEFSSWPEQRLKAFIRNARLLSEIKGTRECISRAVELYTGEKPLIVEARDALSYDGNELYGADIHSFTVIVRADCVTGRADGFVAGLSRLIKYYSPIHARAGIVVLRPYIVLGLHTYLGINTKLSPREALILDEKATADFGMII